MELSHEASTRAHAGKDRLERNDPDECQVEVYVTKGHSNPNIKHQYAKMHYIMSAYISA